MGTQYLFRDLLGRENIGKQGAPSSCYMICEAKFLAVKIKRAKRGTWYRQPQRNINHKQYLDT